MQPKQVERALRLTGKTFVTVNVAGKTLEVSVHKGQVLELLWDLQEREVSIDIPARIEGDVMDPDNAKLVIG